MLRARAVVGTSFLMPCIAWDILVSCSEMKWSRCGNWYAVVQGHPWGTCKGSCPGPQTKHHIRLATSTDCPKGGCPWPGWSAVSMERLAGELCTTFATMDCECGAASLSKAVQSSTLKAAFGIRLINHFMMDFPICIKQGVIFILFNWCL